MTTFDAALLARGWLSVALASTKSAAPAIDRTVSIEQYHDGVRLAATDSYILLHTWVPSVDDELAPEPQPDEAPEAVAVAQDPHGRAKGFMAHVLRLAEDDDYEEAVEIRLRLGVPVETRDKSAMAFDGMDPTCVVVEHPDHERLTLDTFDGPYPNWRKVTGDFHAETTDAVAFHPERIAALSKLGKWHGDRPLIWRFGGRQRTALFEVGESFPFVAGAAMPVRWDLDRNAPAETPEPPVTSADDQSKGSPE